MKKLCVLVAVLLLVLAASCDTKNVGTGQPNRGPIPIVTVPTGMFGAQEATWVGTVQTGTGTAPYTYAWNFGGGATPNTATTANVTAVMVNASQTDNANYTYTLTVTDSQGLSNTATGSYTVGPLQNQAPVIESANYAGGVLTVSVSDPDDGETLTVSVSAVTGLNVDAAEKVASATGPFTATFNFSPTNLIDGASGTTTVTVNDGKGGTDTDDVAITIDPLVLAADTLYAIPLTTVAATSTPDSTDGKVTVVVAQGTPANAFQYMNGVGIVMPGQWDDTVTPAEFDPTAGAYYSRGSFDVGAVDDTADAGVVSPVDGIWGTMGPGSFLLAPDTFIQGTNLDADTVRIDFNITPIGGSDLTGAGAAGILFNFKLGFGATGTYPLEFQQFEGVNRTFYSDSTSTQYFWGTITNDYTGIANSVTVS